MSRNGNLIKNIAIFAVGSLGSKMLQFLLLPFYTRVLSDAQYGTVDILQSIGTLLLPIVSLTIFDAVFRFAMDTNTKKEAAFSVGIITVIGGSLLLMTAGAVLSVCIGYTDYIWIIIMYTISQMFRSVTSQYIRAIGKVRLFTIDNVLQTLLILLCNILFLVGFHMGIEGYMLGYIVGNLSSFLFVFLVQKLWKDLQFHRLGKELFISMYKFSIPLIPNAICWWLTTMIGRFMVTGYLGAEANGLFAIAFKVPTIVTIVVGVFIQAWQISANTEYEHQDFSDYNSQIFHVLQSLTFILSSLLMLCSKIITGILDRSFYTAWKYIPAMLVGICFFTFAQFLGTLYTANKKTVMAFVSNFVAAIVNIVCNVFLIPAIGVMGASLSMAISYLVFWIFRLIDTRKLVNIQYAVKKIILNTVLTIAIAVVVTLSPPYWVIYGILFFIMLLGVNFKVVKDLFYRSLTVLQSVLQLKRG